MMTATELRLSGSPPRDLEDQQQQMDKVPGAILEPSDTSASG
jgi:hypothetical protein